MSNMLRIAVITLSLFSVLLAFATYFTFRRRVAFEVKNYLPNRSEIKAHILLVTAGMVTISLYTAFEMMTHYDRAMTWRSPMLFVAFTIFAISHWKMYGLQSGTYHRDKTRVEIARQQAEKE